LSGRFFNEFPFCVEIVPTGTLCRSRTFCLRCGVYDRSKRGVCSMLKW